MRNKINTAVQNARGATKILFGDSIYRILAISFALNFLALDYVMFSQATTFRIFLSQNVAVYSWTIITLSILTAIFFGIASAMLVYVLKKRKENSKKSASSGIAGTVFGVIASGCPVCGAWLLPLLGIAGSLVAFPFQGIEIRVLAIALLALSITQSSKAILGICSTESKKKDLWTTVVIIISFVAILFLLPSVPAKYKINFQRSGVSAPTQGQVTGSVDSQNLFDQVNPQGGFAINMNYGNMGYQLVQDGVIDFEKFSTLYDNTDSPLTDEQLKIFTEEGLNKPIVVNRENSYFLLNLFWAFGLANDNPILTEGEITKYGNGQVGSFASTGGWTIATKPLDEYMAKSQLASLTQEQQARLQTVTENTYRPCCGNSTAFPDCNHGMALLGVLELMASNDASEDELFEAAKYFSAFWFPSQAIDVATFFEVTEGQKFADVDARTFVSEQFFSGRGWSQLKGWLESNVDNGNQASPQGGGGCGV